MNQDEIATMFRGQEIRRREGRRQLLLNEMALEGDKATDEVEQAALESIKRQAEAWRQLQRAGYWKRLWAAIRGREA